jgi:hypothetical protein
MTNKEFAMFITECTIPPIETNVKRETAVKWAYETALHMADYKD